MDDWNKPIHFSHKQLNIFDGLLIIWTIHNLGTSGFCVFQMVLLVFAIALAKVGRLISRSPRLVPEEQQQSRPLFREPRDCFPVVEITLETIHFITWPFTKKLSQPRM